MILPDFEIAQRCEGESPLITPFKRQHLQPASVDLTLGIEFLELQGDSQQPIDLNDVSGTCSYRSVLAPTGYVLLPQNFVLASTVEQIDIPSDLVARVEGKSSMARLGLAAHVTAGFCDPGFRGRVTLELVNFSNYATRLQPGKTICQIAFERLTNSCHVPYGASELNSKYQDQATTTGSRYAG